MLKIDKYVLNKKNKAIIHIMYSELDIIDEEQLSSMSYGDLFEQIMENNKRKGLLWFDKIFTWLKQMKDDNCALKKLNCCKIAQCIVLQDTSEDLSKESFSEILFNSEMIDELKRSDDNIMLYY